MKSDREFTGTLLGFDDFVSECYCSYPLALSLTFHLMLVDMVLEDVTELYISPSYILVVLYPQTTFSSETTPQGKKTTKLAQTLLNGNNICMV